MASIIVCDVLVFHSHIYFSHTPMICYQAHDTHLWQMFCPTDINNNNKCHHFKIDVSAIAGLEEHLTHILSNSVVFID